MIFKVRRNYSCFINYYGWSIIFISLSLLFFVLAFKFKCLFFLSLVCLVLGIIYMFIYLPTVFKVGILLYNDKINATYFIKRKPRKKDNFNLFVFEKGSRGNISFEHYFLTECIIDIKDISEYGFYKDMNKKTYLNVKDNIIIVTRNGKRYNIPINQFNISDIIYMLNYIYIKTGIKPIGEMNNYINNV